ncbi:MAG: DnaK suppressor protein [Lysobacterales bacterium]|jgi:DnaK suppressor protein
MTDQELEQFKCDLIALKAELLTLGESLKESGKIVKLDQAAVGRLSRMDAMQGQQMALEASRRREQKVLKVGAALRRIEAGDYGDCLECGEEINVLRLQADPTNSLCIACAE